MPLGTALSRGSDGENIIHFNGIRLRVVGQGDLLPRMISLDDVFTKTINPIEMETTTNIQPFRGTNFIQQRAFLELKTEEFQDYFRINRIIIFAKPMFTMYPR